jgi:hypothetical protein
VATQPPSLETPQPAGRRVDQHDLISAPGQRLTSECGDQLAAGCGEHVEVDLRLSVQGLCCSHQILGRELTANPVPENRARIAAAPRGPLLRREGEHGHPCTALTGADAESPEHLVGALARPVEDERVPALGHARRYSVTSKLNIMPLS